MCIVLSRLKLRSDEAVGRSRPDAMVPQRVNASKIERQNPDHKISPVFMKSLECPPKFVTRKVMR